MGATLRILRSRRGSSIVFVTLAMLAIIAATTTAFLTVVAAHLKHTRHQRDGLQALYMAESGIEEMLDQLATTQSTSAVQREVSGRYVTMEADVETAAPRRSAPLPVGRYTATCQREGAALTITAVGEAPTALGPPVAREVIVHCRRAGERWVVTKWELRQE